MKPCRLKNMFILVGFACIVGGPANLAKADPGGVQILVDRPDAVFTPASFDDNDNSQVILAGSFSNTCFKVGPSQVSIDQDQHRIVIRNQVYSYQACKGAMMYVPYQVVVDFGLLKTGSYDVLVEEASLGPVKRGILNIAAARSSSPDDFLYAPVSDVYMSVSERKSIVLRGVFSNSCMFLREVRVNPRPGGVIEILPIAEMKHDGCREENRPFVKQIALPQGISGKSLLHVRTLNGNAINRVVDL